MSLPCPGRPHDRDLAPNVGGAELDKPGYHVFDVLIPQPACEAGTVKSHFLSSKQAVREVFACEHTAWLQGPSWRGERLEMEDGPDKTECPGHPARL